MTVIKHDNTFTVKYNWCYRVRCFIPLVMIIMTVMEWDILLFVTLFLFNTFYNII